MQQIKKYRLMNVDCALCASKIEKELSKNPKIKYININPAASTLETDYGDLEGLNQIISKTEPGAFIEELNIPGKKESKFIWHLIQIIVVLLLLLTGIFLQGRIAYSFELLIFIPAYIFSGYGVLYKAFKNMIKGRVFDENFLMTIATLGALIINALPEAVAVMLFYNVGEYLQGIAINKSRRSIKSLLAIKPDYANLKIQNELKRVSPEEVKVGDIILVKPGERIPLDGDIIEGSSFADTFALTGEPVPRSLKVNDIVLSGMINKTGLISIKVSRPFSESTISKIMNLVENASQKKAETEKFISTFARYYTPIVVALASAVAFLPPILFQSQQFDEWIYRALVMLVVSCPCALVISIPLGYFGGIGGASRRGILVKGSNYLDALTEVDTIIFDKTGTLTKGEFKVSEIVVRNGFSKEEVLKYAAMAESHSNHPVGQSIVEAYGIGNNLLDGKFEEIPGKGVKANIHENEIIVGNDSLLHQENIMHSQCYVEGTVAHVSINKEYAGYIIISDHIKERSAKAINDLKELGKRIIMFTGDNSVTAGSIAKKLNIEQYYSELLPEQKVAHLEMIMRENTGKGKIAFVGDGINDAPVIMRADVGIAMGGLGSDAAVEASDIVLMEDDPYKVVDAINIAKDTRKIVWQNIVFALGVKLIFIGLGAVGLATMWEAVFGDMGVALLAILNSARILKN